MTETLRITVGDGIGEVSALLRMPLVADSLFVFAHGAGAGMRHTFMEAIADRLFERRVATLRYQFPYMEKGGKRPDPPGVNVATVRAACRSAAGLAAEHAPGVPLVAGGKSMGGRMTSLAAVDGGLPGVRGLAFLGFPLHPAGRPSTDRALHLPRVEVPMLFLQGTRDALADLTLLTPVCDALGSRVRLHVVDGADHSFHMKRSSSRTDGEVLDGLADQIAAWAGDLPGHASP